MVATHTWPGMAARNLIISGVLQGAWEQGAQGSLLSRRVGFKYYTYQTRAQHTLSAHFTDALITFVVAGCHTRRPAFELEKKKKKNHPASPRTVARK